MSKKNEIKPFCNANTNYWIKKLEAFTSPQFMLDCKFLVKYARDRRRRRAKKNLAGEILCSQLNHINK